MDRDLVIELLEKEVWVVQDASILTFCSSWSETFGSLILRFLFKKLLLSSCYLGQLIIVVVTVEKFLYRILPKVSCVFLKLGIIEIFPFFVNIFSIKVILEWWNKWRFHLLLF
jgi:hypothetical protein